MNIEILWDNIHTFRHEILDSGFKRDLNDYSSSLAASQNNILALREIADKILSSLDTIYSGDIPEQLIRLLPTGQPQPFTAVPYQERLRDLIDDTEIQQQNFFNKLNQLINQLNDQIQQNITEIDRIEEFIHPYISEDVRRITKEHLAVLAIVFNERQTITSLKQFAKTLEAWNRVLPIYHQLIKSKPPADVELVEIQNGSIDCVINLDIDIALNLVELFKLGFQVFAAYLSYKKMIEPIIESYHGNKELISQEEERETLMLKNIGTAIHDQIQNQHKAAKKQDKSVDGTAIPKKIEQVTNLITAHIVRGNDLKLLALPESEEPEEDGEEEAEDKIESLRKQSVAARRQLRRIPPVTQQKLLEAYGKINEEEKGK